MIKKKEKKGAKVVSQYVRKNMKRELSLYA
jgi:hypothetical protein